MASHSAGTVWFRLCSMPTGRLPKCAYLWSRELADSGRKSWAYHIMRDIVEGLNLHEFYPSSIATGRQPSCSYLGSTACPIATFVNSWMHSVRKVEVSASVNGGKLSMYRQFKHCPDTEPYVRASLPVGVRRVVAGLRARCLPLQVELGRYTSPETPLSRCICKLCNNGVEHFLLLCPSLIEPRAKFFS